MKQIKRLLAYRNVRRAALVLGGVSLVVVTSAPSPTFGSNGAPPTARPAEDPPALADEPVTDVAAAPPEIAVSEDEAPHLRLEKLGLAAQTRFRRQPRPVPQFTEALAEPDLWPTPPDPRERPRIKVDPGKGPHEPPPWMLEPEE